MLYLHQKIPLFSSKLKSPQNTTVMADKGLKILFNKLVGRDPNPFKPYEKRPWMEKHVV